MPSCPGFIGGSAPSQSVIASSQRTVNWYLEQVGTNGPQHQLALYPSPGFQTWATTADLGMRAAISINGLTYLIMGAGVYQAFNTKTVTKIGAVMQDSNLAQIAYNGPTGNQLCIA